MVTFSFQQSTKGILRNRLRTEGHDLFIKKFLELLATNVILMKIKLEEFGVEWRSNWLIVGVMLTS